MSLILIAVFLKSLGSIGYFKIPLFFLVYH
jgi:hypothetical protein